MQWKATMDQQFAGLLDSSKTLDVWKYGLALRPASCGNPNHARAWASLHISPRSNLTARETALASLTKQELDNLGLPSAHAVISSYSPFSLRVRFLKGFAHEALEILRIDVWSRMAKVGQAHRKCPATAALLMDPVLLVAAAFDREKHRNEVPSWRDGDAGAALQISMARLLSIRYFDIGQCNGEVVGNGFRSASEWVAFGRLHPFILRCFQDRFGSDQSQWGHTVESRWCEIMRGDWDMQIKSLSDVFPESFDLDVAQMLDRARLSPSVLPCHSLAPLLCLPV